MQGRCKTLDRDKYMSLLSLVGITILFLRYHLLVRIQNDDWFFIVLLSSYVLQLLFVVLWVHFLYRAWRAIQGEGAWTSAGKAIGLLFIPLLNFFWVFNAIPGLALDVNTAIRRRTLNIPAVPIAPAFLIPILAALGAPYLPIVWILKLLFRLLCFVMMIVFVRTISDSVNGLMNALRDSEQARAS